MVRSGLGWWWKTERTIGVSIFMLPIGIDISILCNSRFTTCEDGPGSPHNAKHAMGFGYTITTRCHIDITYYLYADRKSHTWSSIHICMYLRPQDYFIIDHLHHLGLDPDVIDGGSVQLDVVVVGVFATVVAEVMAVCLLCCSTGFAQSHPNVSR